MSRLDLTARPAVTDHAHQDLTEGAIEPLDVSEHAHGHAQHIRQNDPLPQLWRVKVTLRSSSLHAMSVSETWAFLGVYDARIVG